MLERMDVPAVSDAAAAGIDDEQQINDEQQIIDDEQQTDDESTKKHANYVRFSKEQTALLQGTYEVFTHPDETLLGELATKLDVPLLKVKYWFQNKRTQAKRRRERQNSHFLRSENKKIQTNNLLIRENVKANLCSFCRSSNSKCCSLMMQKLNVEGEVLRKEQERLSLQLELLQKNNGMNRVLLDPTIFQSSNPSQENIPNHNNETIPPEQHVHDPHPPNQSISTLPQADDAPVINQEFYPNTSALPDIPPPSFATIPVSDPLFCPITSSPSENIPNLYHANAPAPSHVQSSTTIEPAQNTPTGTIPHDYQDIPALFTDLDQDMPTLEQDIFAPASAPVMDIPTLDGQDIFAPAPAANMDIPTLDGQDIPSFGFDQDFGIGVLDDGILSNPTILTTDMMEKANNAMEELTKLLNVNEPFWSRSLIDGKFILQRETYQQIYPKDNSLNRSHAYIESSKDSRTVSMSGTQLVDMLLNADKFVDLFPTIVKSAQTLQIFESGVTGSRDGALQLMNAEMHILSPLVPARHFVFHRFCKRVGVGVWVIADASLDSSMTTPLSSKRFPSGCMIHEIGNGRCRVTWVEHVEVNDGIQTDQLFREVISRNNAYGAERWVLTLERMCERFASASLETIPITDAGGVISSTEGRRNLMKFAHRMMKMFYGTLDMKNNMDFPHLNMMNNDSGVRVCVQKSLYPSGQEDVIVSVATSFWLPLLPHIVFGFLKDNTKRPQWDVLCRAYPAHEVQRIINGTNAGNYTSIIRPSIPREKSLLIMQESYTHDLESVLIYAPIDIETLNSVMNGGDTSLLRLLPSGFTITRDGYAEEQLKGKGSLVTLAYQVPRGTPSSGYMQDMDFVTLVNKLVVATVKKIKVGLNCHNI